jgi:alpha-N-arabinofuranosidase
MQTNRRELLRTALTGAAAWLAGPAAMVERLSAAGPDSRIEVLLDEVGATIAPEIYGHFVEHLGAVVYDGIWVGERSSVPNVNGLRKELIDALRKIKAAVIRWPGGCFADQYDWRDGIGPRDQRPKRTNFWVDSPEWPKNASETGPQRYDPNQFGTVDFVRFCRACGAEPYFAANLRSLPAREFWRWVEYCNSPAGSTTLAAQRAADGSSEPLKVKYWGVGNESWGCGGNFSPEDYATEYRRFTAWVPSYGLEPALIGSGPNGDNLEWTRGFFSKVSRGGNVGPMWGWALHHYAWNAAGKPAGWFEGKGDALKFGPEQYYSILHEADLMDRLINAHWGVMGEYDRRHRVKLVVDEWGAWYAPGTEPFPEALLGQQNTMRDAVVAGLTLDTFNRNADKVGMAAIAQLVNCLQSLFFAHENQFCVTPTYHVFDMYSAHQGARSVRTMFSTPEVKFTWNGSPASIRGLTGSASLNGKQLTLTASNASYDQPREAEIVVRRGAVRSVRAWVLAASDPHAHNSFSDPRAVEPKQVNLSVSGSSFVHQFSPASVTKFELTLG